MCREEETESSFACHSVGILSSSFGRRVFRFPLYLSLYLILKLLACVEKNIFMCVRVRVPLLETT